MAQDDGNRVEALNDKAPNQDGRYVLYWMEHSQRAADNPALEHAARQANALGLPLLVLFVVDPDYPEGNARHFTFMLEGLKQTLSAIQERGAHAALRTGSPPKVVANVASDAALVVTDRGYLRHLVEWRREVADAAPCRVDMVEGDVIVPVNAPTQKLETAARTLRPKIHKALDPFTTLPRTVTLKTKAKGLGSKDDETLSDVGRFVAGLDTDASVAPVTWIKGGPLEAMRRLKAFLSDDLPVYGEGRSDIVDRHVSYLSPYLHLGQISPLRVYRSVTDAKVNDDSKKGFVEELLVRRELAVNFVVHANDCYDRFEAIPGWAQESLREHASDTRKETYTAKQLEDGKTDDEFWNAAMHEMKATGYLHNYLRMYWGKRIIGWFNDPKAAYRTTLALNNKYFLDGRDCNSFTNVAWLYGLHDRGWPEREVYGKIRIMKPSGLKRKFNMDAYVRWVRTL